MGWKWQQPCEWTIQKATEVLTGEAICLCSGMGPRHGGQLTLAHSHWPLIVKFRRLQLSLHPGTWAQAWLSLWREKRENVFISSSTCNKLRGWAVRDIEEQSCLAKCVITQTHSKPLAQMFPQEVIQNVEKPTWPVRLGPALFIVVEKGHWCSVYMKG